MRLEDLASFIALAEDLKVKGLYQDNTATNTHTAPQLSEPVPPPKTPLPPLFSTPKQEVANIQEAPTVATESLQQWYGVTPAELHQSWKQVHHEFHQWGVQVQSQEEYQDNQENIEDKEQLFEESQYQEQASDRNGGTDDVPFYPFPVKPNNNCEELDETINSMMQKLDVGRYSCNVCGNIQKFRCNMARHIEHNHIEGILHPCKMCVGSFKSRSSLATHVSRKHKK